MQTTTIQTSRKLIEDAVQLIDRYRIKATKGIPITERELYDVEMLLHKSLDSLDATTARQ